MWKLFKSFRHWGILLVCAFVVSLLCSTGCSPVLSSAEKVVEFEKAGPISTRFHTGPYRVVSSDILELHMPAILRATCSYFPDSLQETEPYLCRISDAGTINLPLIGEVAVVGKRLAEIELLMVKAYYPKYVTTPPTVVCKVKEYEGEKMRIFTVMGLVKCPDTFPYPPNVQYNLMEALAHAGGLDPTADPRYVKIYRKNTDSEIISATFGVDDSSLANAYNLAIKPGDVIYVDHTLRTRVNTLLSQVLRIGVGADVRYSGD
jgi:protein involved in polysaccharide export with SLBB domain